MPAILKPFIWVAIFLLGVFHYNTIDYVDPVVDNVTRIVKKVDPKQLACMATNIFYEAGHEDLLGQAAVARVVMNRIRHGFANTPCGVVHQKTVVDKGDTNVVICQFSWSCDENRPPVNKHSAVYKSAERVAYEVLAYDGFQHVVPQNTLFFHSTNVDPGWPYREVATIGNHVFYSKQRKLKHEQNKNQSR